MKVFMVIIFILSNGQEMVPSQGPFVPRPFDTIEQCERVRLAAIEYIEWAMKTQQIPNYYAGYKVTCKDSEGE